MKNSTRHLLFTVLIGATFQMCSKEEQELAAGKVQFTFNTTTANNTDTGRHADDLPPGSYLLVTIINHQGYAIMDRARMDLLTFGEHLISDPIELPAGNYSLTEFLVVSPDNEILYATPKAGSTLAKLIDNPLPLPFTIAGDHTLNFEIEVIDVTTSAPEDFGYLSFKLEVVKPLELQIAVAVPSGSGSALTSCDLFILKDTDTLNTYVFRPQVNTIYLSDQPDETFTLVVAKDAYVRYRLDFTYNEILAALEDGILKIELVPALTMLTYADEEQGEYQISFEATWGKQLTVDWGDGTVETITVPSIPSNFEIVHSYSSVSEYYIAISGDLDHISSFYAYYGMAPFKQINFDHLTEMSDLRMGLTRSPRVIDLRHNLNLSYVDLSNCTDLETLRLSPHNQITNLSIDGPNNIDSDGVDNIIDALYQSVQENGRQNGYFWFRLSWSQWNNDMTGPPSPNGMEKLVRLKNDHNWNIYPDPLNPI